MRSEFLETKQQATFSRLLREEIGLRLANREQVMLLLNRRGFSSFMVCRACGERLSVRELLCQPDVSPARPAHVVPLLRACGASSRAMPASATAITSSFWARVLNEWRMSFISISRSAYRTA